MESLRSGLAFRTRPTAPTQACTQTGAATTSQNDPIRAERPRGRAWGGATSSGNSFVHRLRTRPRLSRAKRHFGGSLHPPSVLVTEPSSTEGLEAPKGVLPVPGPPMVFIFDFRPEKSDMPNRTCHGTRPQDGRRYAVPPSPAGQRSKSPAVQFRRKTSVHPPWPRRPMMIQWDL